MEKLEDIVLKKGDIVYYINACGERSMLGVDGYDGCSLKEFESGGWVTIEVKRPTQYKTIYKAPKQILDQKEKEYLEAVIRPFRDRVKNIMKFNSSLDTNLQAISIEVKEDEIVDFPTFEKGTMYKGMELNKEYTLKELGLFEGE